MFTGIQIIDISPVGNEETIPLKVLLQPFGKILIAGMNRHTVDAGRVNHHRECTGKGSRLEGFEVFLTNHLRREISRRAVLTRPRSTVGKVMLCAGTYMVLVDMVGIITLITLDLGFHHTCIDNGILAETLPDTGPTGITTQVNHGVVHPRTVTCTTLICCNLSTCSGKLCIERSTDIDRLREKGSVLDIGHTMVMIKTIDIWDAEVLHRLLLNNTNPLLPFTHTRGTGTWSVKDGANLPFGDKRIKHGLVELPYPFGLALVDIHREATQSVDDLLISQLQHVVDILGRTSILLKY